MGEIFSRLSRHVKHSETEWIRRMIHSLLLFRQALDVACNVINSSTNPGHDPRRTYFQQIAGRSAMQAKLIEEGLVNELKNNVLKYCTSVKEDNRNNNRLVCSRQGVAGVDNLPGTLIPKPGSVYPSSKIKSTFNASWLEEVLTQCVKNPIVSKKEELECQEIARDIFNVDNENIVQTEPDSNLESVMVHQTKCKINFDLVQEAIRKLVSEVSSEVRAKYDAACRRVPRGLIEKRLSSELIMRLSPGSQGNMNLVEAFEEAILFEDESEYFQSGSVTDGSTIAGDLSDGQSIFYENQTSEESECYDSSSEDESLYETLDIEIFPCATHTSKSKSVPVLENTQADSDINSKEEYLKTVISKPSTPNIQGRPFSASVSNVTNGRKAMEKVQSKLGGVSNASALKQYSSCRSVPVTSGVQKCGNYDSAGRWIHGIPTVWKSFNIGETKESQYKHFHLSSVEEMSALTERDRSRHVIEASVDNSSLYNVDLGENIYLNESKLCQTVGHVACKVGDAFRDDNLAGEACELYKYALGVLLDSVPPSDSQVIIIADVIRSIGLIKCSVGDVNAGVQLLDECIDMYDCGPNQIKPINTVVLSSNEEPSSSINEPTTTTTNGEAMNSDEPIMSPKQRKNMLRASETSFQKGNAICADSYRQDLLLARVMKQTRRVALEVHRPMTDENLDVGSDCEEDEDKDDEEDYLVCIEEAIQCYKHAQTLLEQVRNTNPSSPPYTELYISVISNLADCYVLSGHLEPALQLYER